MAAGRWVFPITMVLFIVILAAFTLSSTTVAVPESMPGDTVFAKYTGYYDAENAYVYFTSDEEFYLKGAFNRGPYPIGFNASLTAIPIPADTIRNDRSFEGLALGRRVNDTFSTPHLRGYYGTWQGTRELSRVLEEFDLNSTEAPPGQSIPAEQILPFATGTPALQRDVTLDMLSTGKVGFVLDLQVGDAFVFEQDVGDWESGAYKVTKVEGDAVTALWAPATPRAQGMTPAHLIGETIWFTFKVVEIEKGTADQYR